MWKWIQRQSGPTLTFALLLAAAVLVVIALIGSNKIKALAAVDLLPL